MKIAAIQAILNNSYHVNIHVTENPPAHQEFRFFDAKDIFNVYLDTDTPFQRDTVEYTASVLFQHLPHIYNELQEGRKMEVIYSATYIT